MRPQAFIGAFSLLGIGIAAAQNCTFQSITPSTNLVWCRCEGPFYCAKLDVPLDYLNPQLGRASVPLMKLPADPASQNGPYRGMILINPGGPGGSGIELARSSAIQIQPILGSNYDIVGFDPRGIGLSEPRASCSAGNSTRRRKTRNVPRLGDAFYNERIEIYKDIGERCQATIGADTAAGPHMTTATTARDMLSIVEAFAATPDGARAALNSSQLNYYGISYGTFLGQTFASMFPDRVGHVALDAVLSPEGYQENGTYPNMNHVDGILGAFFIYCHAAGPGYCAYYTGDTPMNIFERWNASFSQLDARTAEAEGWENATEIASALRVFKDGILSVAIEPLASFGIIAPALVRLEQALDGGYLAVWTEQVKLLLGESEDAEVLDGNLEQNIGVTCSDQKNRLYGKSLEDLRPLIKQLEDQSVIGEIWATVALSCTGWSISSNDVFEGPYGGNTSYPLLFVSNTFDPTTPIENAIANAPKFRNSRRLTIDGLGHNSFTTDNLCGFEAIRSYFQDKMCGREHYCPLEIGPFGVQLNGTIQQNLETAGLARIRDLY
ncbi:uncharacterized protein CTRU02_209588 [Colletotrichum truncatum]|uniref:Uncharacterized protein n=1 Tax=Colletotrichum truncatum TaxID=5467 RepID=A0ACC3YV31_COLTU|nr:uncharacterized protein CTRU02_12105 [Colletotrichum truncatum]KAF6785173.1 hypothetical protein CTRU02_12105 [Colletotrichum truncatum]